MRRKSHASFGLGAAGKGPAQRAPRQRPTSTLRHNLGEAVEKAVARHRQHLAAAVSAHPPDAAGQAGTGTTPAPERGGWIAARTHRRHAEVHRLPGDGRSQAAIAAEPGLSRNTVRRFARAADPGELLVRDRAPRAASILHDYEPYLRERRNSGCTNATMPWQEIRARGYPGGYPGVPGPPRAFPRKRRHARPRAATAQARAVTAWIMTRPGDPDPGDQASLDAIVASSPELAALTTQVRASATMMTARRGRGTRAGDNRGRRYRRARAHLLRYRPARRPGRGHRRADAAAEPGQRGRTRQPDQDAQTPDVRTGKPRPAPPPRPARRLTPPRKLCQSQNSSAVDRSPGPMSSSFVSDRFRPLPTGPRATVRQGLPGPGESRASAGRVPRPSWFPCRAGRSR